MIERHALDLPVVRKAIRRVHENRRTGWVVSEKKPDYSGILMKLSLGALRTRQMAADSSPGIPAILRQCFTNWLFREFGCI